MSKYNPLSERLSGHADDEWRASFAELEEVLGFPLPKGARSGSSWWANDPEKGHSRAWTGAGWEVAEVDRPGEAVTFRRNRASADIEAAGGVETPSRQPKRQPEVLRQASQAAARDVKLRRAMPAIAAGAAVVAGLATYAAKVIIRRNAMRP